MSIAKVKGDKKGPMTTPGDNFELLNRHYVPRGIEEGETVEIKTKKRKNLDTVTNKVEARIVEVYQPETDGRRAIIIKAKCDEGEIYITGDLDTYLKKEDSTGYFIGSVTSLRV